MTMHRKSHRSKLATSTHQIHELKIRSLKTQLIKQIPFEEEAYATGLTQSVRRCYSRTRLPPSSTMRFKVPSLPVSHGQCSASRCGRLAPVTRGGNGGRREQAGARPRLLVRLLEVSVRGDERRASGGGRVHIEQPKAHMGFAWNSN